MVEGPGRSLCPLARPDIVMGLESQIEAWSALGIRRCTILLSQNKLASCLYKQTTVFISVESHRFVAGSGTTYLIGDLGDSDVGAKDTEVVVGPLLTSPFIEEGSRGALIQRRDMTCPTNEWIEGPWDPSASSAGFAGDFAQDDDVMSLGVGGRRRLGVAGWEHGHGLGHGHDRNRACHNMSHRRSPKWQRSQRQTLPPGPIGSISHPMSCRRPPEWQCSG
jgi:hypothetical protein